MSEIEELTQAILDFRDNRQWAKYHTPKNLSMSIAIEAAELMERFQWRGDEHGEWLINLGDVHPDFSHVCDELADVLIYCLLFADTLVIDIPTIIKAKLEKNAVKYPSCPEQNLPPIKPQKKGRRVVYKS